MNIKTKNKFLITLSVFLILFVLIGSVSAANDNTPALSHDTDKDINLDEISTGNDDSSLEMENNEILKANDENTTLKEPVGGRDFSDIQDAIDDAESGDTIELIGEYKGSGDDIAIEEDDLTIIGTDGAILDAQGQSRILNIDAKGVILKDITFKSGSGDEHGGAVHIKDKGDVTFINCSFDGNNAKQGGALFVDDDATVSFINCSFTNNTSSELSGGAVYVDENAAVSFTNCLFNENIVTGEWTGGAVYVGKNAEARFTNCSFDKNKAMNDGGGAVYVEDNAAVSFTNCLFTNNYETAGGVVSMHEDSAVNFTNCSFINNDLQYQASVIYAWYSKFNFTNCSFINSISYSDCSPLRAYYTRGGSFTNCLFDNNDASYIMFAQYGALNLTNCSFTNNHAFHMAYFSLTEEYNLINCSFTNNSGHFGAVAVLIDGENEGMANFIKCSFDNNYDDTEQPEINDYGGAVCICNTGASFINCSFTNNNAYKLNGGAVYIHETYSTYFINCSFTNNNANTGGAVFVENDGANFTDCSFTNNNANAGGAVYVQNGGANFTGCLFTNHSVDNEGGAVYIESGEGSFNKCSFTNNDAKAGGAVFVKKDDINFTDCSFTNNSVINEGGAVYIDESGVSSFNNCSFTNNNASVGGAIYTKKDKTLIKYSKFTENNATVGQAIKTEKDISISDSEFLGNGEYCIDVKLGANVILDNVLYDAPLINTIFIKILEAEDVVYGNNVSIKVQVNSSATTLLNIGKVVVKVKDVEYESDVKDGIATFVLSNLDAGSYNVNVTYFDDIEPKAETPVNFNVSKASAEIIIANDTLNVTVFDSISAGATLNPAEAGDLTYASSDSNVAIVENGTIKALSIGTAVITVSSTGNNNYDAADEKNITVNVLARIWYVDDDAAPNGDGRSIETAFRTFKYALDAAGHDDIIMIAEGSYSYGGNVDLTISTENLTIMNYGDGEAIFDAHEECTIWDCGVNVNIIGLTFKGARSQTIGDSQGGALNLVGMDNDNVHVKDCKFINNAASYGGAMFIYSGTVTNCTFIDNNADSNGGAVFMQYGTITTCTFIDNTSPHGGAICCGMMEGIVADTCIFKSGSDSTVRVSKHPPTMNGDMFTTVNNSGEKLTFDLKTNSGIPVDNGNISIKLYNKTNDVLIDEFSCLSGEGWAVDLPAGFYYAIFNTEYAKFKPITRLINVLPDIGYYVNVTPATSKSLTVDLFAKSNIPQDIVEGKLQFILPNGTEIDAVSIHDDEWWAEYTFDDYGDYEVSASYIGLNNVTINNATISIFIKPKSDVNVTDVVLNYGESKNVTVNTTGATGITAKINNVDVKVDGFTIEIPVMDVGNYTLTVTTIPDDDHSPVTKTAAITVNKAPAEIIVDSETVDIKVFDEVSSGATLTPADAGNLTYKSSNETIVIVKDGKIKALGKGTANITVSFAGNENYTAANNMTITVNVDWADACVSVNNSTLDLFVDDNFTIVSTTTPDGLNVTYIADNSGVVSVDDNGVVIALKEGTAIITVKVGGDGFYVENTTTVTVTVSKLPTEITAEGCELYIDDNATISYKLIPEDAEGDVRFMSNDTNIVYADAETGIIVGRGAGTATVTVTYFGNDKYESSKTNVTITVSKIPTEIIASEVVVAYKDPNGELVAIITDAKGNPLSVNMTVNLNGKIYLVKSDSDGQISIPVGNLTPKNYVASISYVGDDTYVASSATANVVVEKAGTIISAQDVSLAYKDPNGVLVATIVSEHGKPLVVNLNVELNGKTYTVRTNSSGQAIIPIGNMTPGTYAATVSYKGSSNYKASTTTVQVKVTKAGTVISANGVSIAYRDPNGELVATIVSEHGKPLVVNLNVELNGKTYTVRTNSSGQASLSLYDVAPGTYAATVSYKGSSNYKASTTTAQVKVTKADTAVSANGVSIAYRDPNGELVANIVNEHGKPLVVNLNIELNGKTYAVRTDSSGQASLSLYDVTPGTYAATVSYKGSSNYKASTTTAQVKVTKAGTVISASDVSFDYRDPNGVLVVNVVNEHGKTLDVELNVDLDGKTYTVRTNSSGQASLSLYDVAPGTHTATIKYKGSSNYEASTTTAQVKVTKAGTVISASDVSFDYRDPNSELVVNVVNEHGKPLVVNLNVELNGKTYTVRTNSSGQASLSLYGVTPGNYTATISYKGSGNYEASTTTAQVVVSKAGTIISAPDVSVAYGDPNGKFVSTIVNEYGKPLVVNMDVVLNGKVYSARTDSNGQMSVSTADLAPGTYAAIVYYTGSSNYEATLTTASVQVKK